MHIRNFLQKGEFHPVFCEDFLFHTQLDNKHYVAAVMDGCTSGRDSHFASSLTGKILKKVIKELGYREFAGDIPPFQNWQLGDLGKLILQELWEDFRKLKGQLHLEELELLSTLNLALVRPEEANAWNIIIGDGFMLADNTLHEIDQENKPDYLAYHLAEDFEAWYASLKNIHSFSDIRRLSIATDGLGSFEKLLKEKPDFPDSVEKYLLWSSDYSDSPKALERKLDRLKVEFGLLATDDLGVIEMKWG